MLGEKIVSSFFHNLLFVSRKKNICHRNLSRRHTRKIFEPHWIRICINSDIDIDMQTCLWIWLCRFRRTRIVPIKISIFWRKKNSRKKKRASGTRVFEARFEAIQNIKYVGLLYIYSLYNRPFRISGARIFLKPVYVSLYHTPRETG